MRFWEQGMKQLGMVFFLLVILGVGLGACNSAPASTALEAEGAWIRAASLDDTTAAFLTLHNPGSSDDRLRRVESSEAEAVEIHQSFMENDVMKMRQVDGIDLPAGETVELQPGGLHIMLIGLRSNLEPGDEVNLVLVFENNRPLAVQAEVRERQ